MKILTINLCASWNTSRKARLGAVADYVLENKIDIVFYQEGIRSCFFYNTGKQLEKMCGMSYFIAKSTFGWPFFFEFMVGILSSLKIISTDSKYLEVSQTEFVDSIPLPWRKRVVMIQVDYPSLGIINLISTHLTSNPSKQSDRKEQFSNLLTWIQNLPKSDITVLGGDFNVLVDNPVLQSMNLYGFDKVVSSQPDFIFVRGDCQVKGQVIFTDNYISDHYGVVVEITK
jgi:endonuclease/exonuclease/phosphatase family metal-dependent hydrolase